MKTNVKLHDWLWDYVPVKVYPLGRGINTRLHGGEMSFESLGSAVHELVEASLRNSDFSTIGMHEKREGWEWNNYDFRDPPYNLGRWDEFYQCLVDGHDWDVFQFMKAIEDGEYVFAISFKSFSFEVIFDTDKAQATVDLQYTYFDKEEQ